MPPDWNLFFKVIVLLFSFIVVVLGAYYVAKLTGTVQLQKNQGKNIKVLESVGIGPQKGLQLIQVGTQVFLIGVTKDQITFMTEVSPDAVVTPTMEAGEHFSFQSYLNQWMRKGDTK